MTITTATTSPVSLTRPADDAAARFSPPMGGAGSSPCAATNTTAGGESHHRDGDIDRAIAAIHGVYPEARDILISYALVDGWSCVFYLGDRRFESKGRGERSALVAAFSAVSVARAVHHAERRQEALFPQEVES